MECTMYVLHKKLNSTYQPSSLDIGDLYDIQLKDSTSIINPTIIINQKVSYTVYSPYEYNYCYIPTLNRYYWIVDCWWEQGIWYISMRVDVLASYKTYIGQQTQFIVRSASNYDTSIIDNVYLPIGDEQTILSGPVSGTFPFSMSMDEGCYILAIAGNATGIGGVQFFKFRPDNFKTFVHYLQTDFVNLVNVTDITDNLLKAIVNPFQYIQSLYWLPFDPTIGDDIDTNDFSYGYWVWPISSSDGSIEKWNGDPIGISFSIPIPKHPQAATRGNWINYSNACTYILSFPPYGEFSLDKALLSGDSYLWCHVNIDIPTGNSILYLYAGSSTSHSLSHYFGSYNGKLGVSVPISNIQQNTDTSGIFGRVMGTATALLGNEIEKRTEGRGFLSTALRSVGTAVEEKNTFLQVFGSLGSVTQYASPPRLFLKYFNLSDDRTAELGRPLLQFKQINTLSGYIQIDHADIEIPSANMSELEQIIKFMEDGFFYE